MKTNFGLLPDGKNTALYTITGGGLKAVVSDYGAALVRLFVPDKEGNLADVVLGFDDPDSYTTSSAFLGVTVGRNANRVKGASFKMGDQIVTLGNNENGNNLHSGPNPIHTRLWQVEKCSENAITFRLDSPHGDQGFPGNAVIRVTYALEDQGTLRISYDAVADRDTVFNMTNHSYFNLAGHDKTDRAMEQILSMPARFFCPDDAQNIPTGELRSVADTPMDFRKPKAIGQDIGVDYEPLHLQGGYDHNFEVWCNPCAILSDPASGRTMAVHTDCPGIQLYAGNYLNDHGKDGVYYCKRSGVALETQFYPDSVNHPEWVQPFVKAGQPYHSTTKYVFSW